MKRHLAVLLMLGMLPGAGLHAQTPVTTTFIVKARVQSVCEITASDLDFGNYSAQSASPLQGTTILRATCSPNTIYDIGLNEGTSGGTINARRMVSAGNNLNYQLYSDAARSKIWGNTGGTDTVSGTGTGLAVDHTVYGAIPATQTVPGGDYSDTITVRIYF